ncbi:hypothetical protein VP01_595g3 [Puccinia sorghi]|uniref:RRM domain-containing protein n=1 Tax=Puccinia sorghi TaxID=27349 RepID=A0A0L6UIE4_9BASI|nr:hypothetical protein VP01_595g3 [Puccinia sorghi]
MDRTSWRRLSLSSTSSSTLISSMKTIRGRRHWQEYEDRKRWEWLDLSDSPRRSFSSECHSGSSSSDPQEAEEEDSGWEEDGEEDRYNADETRWQTHPQPPPTQNQLLTTTSSTPNHHQHLLSFPGFFNPTDQQQDKHLEDGLKFYQPKNRSSKPVMRFRDTNSGKNAIPNRGTIGAGTVQEANFMSSNIYLRPLPSSFTPLDLHELCMSMIRRTPEAKLLTLDPLPDHQDLNLAENTFQQEFRILSVKVMVEEEDQASLGSCKVRICTLHEICLQELCMEKVGKPSTPEAVADEDGGILYYTGFGFCLWNSVEAATSCIEGLRAHGYQASYARESSRGMLASLADPTSANIYLSNLPFHWGEEELGVLFGDTPIASASVVLIVARLLRDRDDEAVGSGASRGVGFVRLACRSDALHFVELLHGMPIPGTKCHLQCRMADSQAQKEYVRQWKRHLRSSLKQQLTLEPPKVPTLPAPAPEDWSREACTPKLKWRNRKVAHKSHSTPANYMAPSESDRRRPHTGGRYTQLAKSGHGLELGGGGSGGFHVVGLGSTAGGFLGFHPAGNHGPRMIPGGHVGVAPPAIPGGHAFHDQPFTPLFPFLPVCHPGGWYHHPTPAGDSPDLNFSPSSETSPTSSKVSPATPAKFPPAHMNWPSPPAGEFMDKPYYYYHHHHHHQRPEIYQPIPDHHLPQIQAHHPSPPCLPPLPPHHHSPNDVFAMGSNSPASGTLHEQKQPPVHDQSPDTNAHTSPAVGQDHHREPSDSSVPNVGLSISTGIFAKNTQNFHHSTLSLNLPDIHISHNPLIHHDLSRINPPPPPDPPPSSSSAS